MCHYITLVVGGVDAGRVDTLLRRHGRIAKPTSNPAIERVLQAGEQQFVTTNACDCGTALGGLYENRGVHDHAGAISKLRSKGWSQSKIDRWLEDKRKANANAEARDAQTAPDSLALWADVIRGLQAELNATSVGLGLHFYAGALEAEDFPVTRVVQSGAVQDQALQRMPEDTLIMFAR